MDQVRQSMQVDAPLGPMERSAAPADPDDPRSRGAHGRHGSQRQSRYVPAIDGLRAFAVLAVIAYHMGLGWAPGGLMGVTVFFVISGYLINGLLIAERDRTGSIDLKAFWLRRVRRLFPAIALAVIGTAALCTLFDHTLLDKMRPDIIPSLLFYNNWWQIFHDVSYFEAAGAPSPLTHFWSLSIEEQFYVVWPLLLLGLFALGARKRTIIVVALGLAVASGVEMAVLYSPTGDPSRIYYGTDTRAVSLLIGVLLAFLWPSAAFGERADMNRRHTGVWTVFNLVSVASLAGLVIIVGFTNGFSSFPYHGGIVATSVLAALLLAVLAVPDTWLAKLFAWAPFVWIGKRSYGMYLWHLPILLLTTDPNTTQATPWWWFVLQLALIFAVSALSYTFIENPIRSGALGRWWKARKARSASRRRRHGGGAGLLMGKRVKAAITSACCVGLLGVACFGLAVVKPTDYAATIAAGGGEAAVEEVPSLWQEGDDGSSAMSSATDSEAQARFDSLFLQPHQNAAGDQLYEPLLIGDSVAAGATDAFYSVFPYGMIDAEVNRNIWESPYPQYRDAGQVGDYVVICLGTNNAVVDWQIDDELLAAVEEDKHVFMVNTRNTMVWLDSTNEEIARAQERHGNVTVVDWYGASAGHDEYFAGDGTHLSSEGAQAYMELIKAAILESLA